MIEPRPREAAPQVRSTPPHASSPEEVLRELGSDAALGLGEAEARERLLRSGPNQLAEKAPAASWKRFLAQFRDLLIGLLFAAAVLSGILGDWTDALAILGIVLVNGILGFLQEEKAERALAALRSLSAPVAKVVRDGVLRTLPARELVPGDRIELEAGDHVPADVRLLESYALRLEEAALTGESLPVEKDARGILDASAPLGDRRNMAYLGTLVASGKAKAVVVSTGMTTELGRIAGLLEQGESDLTPLQKQLDHLGKVLAAACLVLVAILIVLSLLRGGRLLEVFLLSVSLAVAAVPEGLPAVVTITLALGLQRMARRNALVRKLSSVETLGSVSVILSDKTGTLTRNEMTVRAMVADGDTYEVRGTGYSPRGDFVKQGGVIDPAREPGLLRALEAGLWCNNARIDPLPGGRSWRVIGDPTEGSLLVAALKAGLERGREAGGRVVHEIPFDSERKAMSVVVTSPAGSRTMYTKGAPEVILGKCSREIHAGAVRVLTEDRRKEILEQGARLAERALRVLALAFREDPPGGATFEEADLTFAGLTGMMDPPREEVKEAVRVCRKAGIRPVMITGDHPATALAVGRELGIAGGAEKVLTGAELDRISDQDLASVVESIPVYARVTAEHKLRIVQAWRRRGHFIAMTGDGVNDAPAVKAADIGIAMGVTGTDVTKEASDMVLTDDNFASIVNAIEEGRGIYDNIQKTLEYLLSCNLGEILLMFGASLIGWPAPLIPIQLLWVNLVTDGLPALALAVEAPEPGAMQRKPRPPGASVLPGPMILVIVFQGILVGGAAIAAFAMFHVSSPEDTGRARTAAFTVLAFSQLFRAFAARSRERTLFQLGPFTNPLLVAAVAASALLQLSVVTMPFARPVFEAATHFGWEWAALGVLALAPVTLMEVWKLVRARFAGAPGP